MVLNGLSFVSSNEYARASPWLTEKVWVLSEHDALVVFEVAEQCIEVEFKFWKMVIVVVSKP